MAQTQQSKPKLRLFRIRNLFYYGNIVLYYRKCNIFDNIKNIIAILDALSITEVRNLLFKVSKFKHTYTMKNFQGFK